MGAPEDVLAPIGTYTPPRHGWTCFHCGETFSVAEQGCWDAAVAAAREHFGPDCRWRPACVELLTMKPRQIYRRMRRAEMKVAEFAGKEEELDYLQSAAREVHELRDQVDSLEGELEVERLRLREAR